MESGTRLGPYAVLEQLGAGGMGEVWLAEDTRLGRRVAVKVLPPEWAADPERLARFAQEARAAAALNHPNIAVVHDIGEQDGVHYLAMELIEGRTLRETLDAGDCLTRKSLDLSAQIADGLAKAHASGIVHRDLKPENIMVSNDGFAKILDFGLAKLVAAPDGDASHVATSFDPATSPGVVMGTVGYMSPEQACGKAVDYRSDQFSLGTMLYEMVSGSRPFQRDTSAETMAAIIREEPEGLGTLAPRTPPPLRWIVERCLAKEPEDRFVSTLDLARDLAAVRDHLSETQVSGQTAVAKPVSRRGAWWRAASLVAIGLLVGAAATTILNSTPTPVETQIQARRLSFRRGTVLSARFTPDGESVVYTAAWDGGPAEVYSLRLDGSESRSLGLPPADVLAVSSTGELAIKLGAQFGLGWERTGTLARLPLGSSTPRELLEGVESADWSPDGQLAVVRDTGERRQLEFPVGTKLHETDTWISGLRVSPDGGRIAFLEQVARGDNTGRIMVIEDGIPRALRPQSTASNGLSWSPDGTEVWTGLGNAVDLSGNARRWVQSTTPTTIYLHDTLPDGRVLTSDVRQRREIVGHLRGDSGERSLSWLDWSFPSALAADGNSLLVDEQNQGTVYLRRQGDSGAVLLGSGRSWSLSADGSLAVVSRLVDGAQQLVLVPTGAGDPKVLSIGDLAVAGATLFATADRVLLVASVDGAGRRLWVLDVAGGDPRPISPAGVSTFYWPAISPDGSRAVAMGPDGVLTIYPVEGGEPSSVAGVQPGDVPSGWAADSRRLYVLQGARVPATVDLLEIETGERTRWRELSPPDPAGILTIGPLHVTPDGAAYVYSYRRVLHMLALLSGVQ